jgi:hypothetical protein
LKSRISSGRLPSQNEIRLRDHAPGGANDQGTPGKNFVSRRDVVEELMRMITDRAVLTVLRHDGIWAVELEGEMFGESRDREVAKAAANRRAREIHDSGRACQVRISGETGFYAVP